MSELREGERLWKGRQVLGVFPEDRKAIGEMFAALAASQKKERQLTEAAHLAMTMLAQGVYHEAHRLLESALDSTQTHGGHTEGIECMRCCAGPEDHGGDVDYSGCASCRKPASAQTHGGFDA